jgi:hypothetical protein
MKRLLEWRSKKIPPGSGGGKPRRGFGVVAGAERAPSLAFPFTTPEALTGFDPPKIGGDFFHGFKVRGSRLLIPESKSSLL